MAITINNRWIVVEGPVKKEKIHITSDGTNDDTSVTSIKGNTVSENFDSNLARPIAVYIESVNTDLTGTAATVSATMDTTESSATLGRITLRDPAAQDYMVTVYGF